jgi:hypothetical protein
LKRQAFGCENLSFILEKAKCRDGRVFGAVSIQVGEGIIEVQLEGFLSAFIIAPKPKNAFHGAKISKVGCGEIF